MMEVYFRIPGPPKGKQRPRMHRINGRNVVYTPRETVEYENLVKASYLASSRTKFDKDEPLAISIIAFFPVPQNTGKTMKKSMLDCKILPTKKPDTDNVIKIILDALNGVAYHDDAQICKLYFAKIYAKNPRVQVFLRNIKENLNHENDKNL